MKKILILIFSTIFFVSGYSQASKFSIGTEFGPSIATLKRNPMDNGFHSKYGFSTGISIEYLFSNHFSLKSGLFYDTKGAKIKSYDYERPDIEFNYDCISLPVLISFSIGNNARVNFSSGCFLGYFLSAKDSATISYKNEEYNDNNHEVTKIDFGLAFELGLTIPVSEKIALSYSVKDNLGMRRVSRFEADKTYFINFSMGIKYKI